MATRSNIGKLNSNNTVTYIYCHWDGYPSHNGTILQEHYNTPEKVDALLVLGDMSVLGETIGECEPYDEPDTEYDEPDTEYDEPDTEAATTILEEYNNSPMVSYFYLFTDEGWKVSNGGEWILLKY